MASENEMDRRAVLAAGAGLLLGATGLGAARPPAPKVDPDRGVTAPEDLMREHGVLNRCLLIYEEGIRRLRGRHPNDVPPEVFNHTAFLVRSFVEDYHERNEERYLFPLFQPGRNPLLPAKYLPQAQGVGFTALVATLKAQHDAGRQLTSRILALSLTPDIFHKKGSREQVIAAAEAFVRMYRPHENWEDTVLYPAIRTVLTPAQVASLGDRMEEDEHRALGDEGFEKAVVQVAAIEKSLGLYDLSQYTPHV